MTIRVVTKFDGVKVPHRSTEHSAGYDVFSDRDIQIPAGQDVHVLLPSGMEFNPEENRVLIFLRSSMGMKKNLRLVLGNEIVPHMELEYDQPNKYQFVTLRNVGTEQFTIEKDMHFLQFVVLDKDEAYLPFTYEKVKDLQGSNPVALSVRETQKGLQLVLEESVKIKKGERTILASGLRFKIKMDSVLFGTVPESEKRFSYSNGKAVIDSDYFYAENEGHCFFSLDNVTDKDLELEPGTPFVELISIPFYKADNEFIPTEKRTGGIGSTTETKK